MALSFIFACIVVLAISIFMFYFLSSLNSEFELITNRSSQVTLVQNDVRISAIDLLRHQRSFTTSDEDKEQLKKEMIELCEHMRLRLTDLENLYSEPEVKRILTQMSSYTDSLKVILSQTTFVGSGRRNNTVYASMGDMVDRILESYSRFAEIQYIETRLRKERYEKLIENIKKNMMTTLLIGLLGTIILGFIVPGKIALPFKKIQDALRELQDCNFDVNIYYNHNDEIGEIAKEMNKMIHSIKVFEELRADKISVENRKFDALANVVKKPILVSNAKGELIYMNGQLYSLLACQSEEVLGRPMKETVIPKGIIHIYDLAIKRRSKIENEEIVLSKLLVDESEQNGEAEKKENGSTKTKTKTDTKEAGDEDRQEIEPLFKGHATVIPIRGKKSSLDYYLMVLSKEVMS